MLSMLDRLWHPDLTLEEAQDLMEKGIEEVPALNPALLRAFCGLRSLSHNVS